MGKPVGSRVMSAREAISKYVFDGAVVGLGGQSIGRCSMALAHEIVRQGMKDLTLVGCNLAVSMDIMVGAGLVKRTECGTGNLERYGTAFRWRSAIEEGRLEVADFSHLAMASRFLAGSLGLPFMPSKSLLGTDLLAKKKLDGPKPFSIIDNPWKEGDPVVLLPALTPDVSIVHVQKADEMGNLVIEGFAAHEPEMIKASRTVIASCEELISSDETRRNPDRTTIPYIYVDAVVEQRWGAHPTSVYRHYEHDDVHIRHYQTCAREGGESYDRYLQHFVYGCSSFDQYLDRASELRDLTELRDLMSKLL